MTINVKEARRLLQDFDFQNLFVEVLGWNRPPRGLGPATWSEKGIEVTRKPIAELGGVLVFEVTTADGTIPDEAVRRAIDATITQSHYEHLLIFVNADRTSSLWYWIKRDGGKSYPRRHAFVRGQPGDLLIAKLSAMFVDISELDQETGALRLVDAINRVRQALDVEPVTRSFYSDFQRLHDRMVEAIKGVSDEQDRRWYASVLLNRLMFVYFLQRRGFLDVGDYSYLQHKFDASRQRGKDQYYREFLRTLFFEGFAKPEGERGAQVKEMIGNIRYLNGGLFLPHEVEQTYDNIQIDDQVFGEILDLFASYDWALDDSPTGNEREINPAVLGYIFEKYINQKAFGAYYTRTEITEYLCEQTIHRIVLDRANETLPPGVKPFETVGDLLLKPPTQTCRLLLRDILPGLRLIDPACGSGAFLAAAMRTLIEIYSGLVGKAKFAGDGNLDAWLQQIEHEHPSIEYFIKKQIIVNNLYGVDIMAEAVEIARLRLFLALVAAARTVDDLEPLPNIDFNILAGNSLIGLLRVDEHRADEKVDQQREAIQPGLFGETRRESYRQIVAEKNRLVATYRNTAKNLPSEDLSVLRDDIQDHRAQAAKLLDAMLLDDFQTLGVRYEEATWDFAAGKEGKPRRRAVTLDDIRALHPFHWGYEFDEVMNARGGFDAIITNPPWEVYQTDEKEFFQEYESAIQKKKLRLEVWKKQQAALMQDPAIRQAWLDYVSRFPHVVGYLKAAPQFRNQISFVDGRNVGSKVNLYSYFVEQCFNLLRTGGQCGIVVPSGIYTDVGTKQLREMLFTLGAVRSLLTVSNERFLFEGVDHRFKYSLLIFEKDGTTLAFTAAFRINPREAVGADQLDGFLNDSSNHLAISVDIVRRLSPDTLSVMEFRSPTDIAIAEKMLRYPLLGQKLGGSWNLVLTSEFNITSDSELFETTPGPARLPLFTGKMFNQFTLTSEHSGYWIDEKKGRANILRKVPDTGQRMDHQGYRWIHRRIARNTDSRTFITTIAPPMVFTEVNSTSLDVQASNITPSEQVYLCAVCNSMTLDWMLRQKVAATLNMFYIYQLPVPRLTWSDPRFEPIVERAAQLICTTPEYDALAAEVGLGDHRAGVTDPGERNRLRAELDGLVAHLYGLGEEELTHILGTFPLVEDSQKQAVLNAFRAFAPNPDDARIGAVIAARDTE